MIRIILVYLINICIYTCLVYNPSDPHSHCFKDGLSGYCVQNRHCCSQFYDDDNYEKGDCPGNSLCCTEQLICQECDLGFKEQNHTCVDINECEEVFGVCSGHKCNNTIGSYECECFESFEMIGEYQTCRHINFSKISDVLFTESFKINIKPFKLEGEVDSIKMLYSGTVYPKSIDYNFKGNYMAWTDISTKMITIAPVNYRNPSSVMDRINLSNLGNPFILSIDWIHNLIYWTDLETRAINVVHIYRTQDIYTVINNTHQIITDFKVNVADSCLVWTHVGPNPRIMRSLEDGTNQSILYSSDKQPFYITIDIYLKVYFFVDIEHKKLFSIDFDGKKDKEIPINWSPLFSKIIASPIIYGDDILLYDTGVLYKINKFGLDKNSPDSFPKIVPSLIDFKIMDPILQPSFANRCRKSKCSHLCLPSDKYRKFRCVCPLNHILVNNTVCVKTQFANNIISSGQGMDRVLIDHAINRSFDLMNNVNRSIKQEISYFNITNVIEKDKRIGVEVILILIMFCLLFIILILLSGFKMDFSKIKQSRRMSQSHPLYLRSNEESVEEMESKT